MGILVAPSPGIKWLFMSYPFSLMLCFSLYHYMVAISRLALFSSLNASPEIMYCEGRQCDHREDYDLLKL